MRSRSRVPKVRDLIMSAQIIQVTRGASTPYEWQEPQPEYTSSASDSSSALSSPPGLDA